MKQLTHALALVPLLLMPLSAEVPTLAKTVAIGVGAGMQRYDGSFGDHATPYVRGLLSYHPEEWFATRFTGGYGGLEKNNYGQSYKTEWFSNLGVDLVLQPPMGMGIFRPYLASGLSSTFGSSKLDGVVNEELDWNLYVPVELGLEFLVAKNLSIWAWGETYTYMKRYNRLDGVASTGSFFERRDDLLKAGVGFSFFIGGAASDADGDGVLDGLDRCTGTPKDVKIDEHGCPLDADKDKVPDFKDRCPSTPAGAVVDPDGCTFDTDKDGVIDGSDKCPNTARGAKVDDQGCVVEVLDADKDGVSDATDKCPGSVAGSKVNAVGCPLDSDKDGVFDMSDKCANTPAGVKVDTLGCPALPPDADKDGVSDAIDKCPGSLMGSKVDRVGCPLDSDVDGVTDDIDRCPGTPVGAKVDAMGCLLPLADVDHDGVADSLDQCPGTRSGTKVDTSGCPQIVLVKGAKLVMDGIVFKTNSSDIEEVSAPVLARAAVAISKAPDAKILIAGYTDNVGSDAYNQKLSERRAASVKAYLLKSGVNKAQLSSKGYGEADPVVDNSTSDNRSDNRRIEFHVK